MRSHFEELYTRSSGRQVAGTVVSLVTGLIAALLALHIVFVIFDANASNSIVDFVDDVATSLVLGFEDVFTPENEKAGVLLNYGFAAVIYLTGGQLIVRALQR